jgi:hypothetical protein
MKNIFFFMIVFLNVQIFIDKLPLNFFQSFFL